VSIESEHRKRVDRLMNDAPLMNQVEAALELVAKEIRTPVANSSSIESAQRLVGKPLAKRTPGRRKLIDAIAEVNTVAYVGGYLQNADVLDYTLPDEFAEADAAVQRAKAAEVMTPGQFDQLDNWAKAEAFTAANQSIEAIENARDVALVNAIEQGDTLNDVVKALIPNWNGEGRVLSKLHIENVMRTNTLRAYNQGWNDVAFQPGMAERLPVARFAAVADDRTTEVCMSLDGLLMDRKAVGEYTPPLHFMCRSLLLWEGPPGRERVHNLTSLRRFPQSEQPAPGFGAYTPATIAGG